MNVEDIYRFHVGTSKVGGVQKGVTTVEPFLLACSVVLEAGIQNALNEH